ncbi:hypothetical protein BP6252_05132 [Coleophoma cylindrospora]|uniref:Uncharacterized protein n=1 Tax=Coleophoma cylindrospora TaxID=1849047 RepID=A0A3D8RSR2_9HELO|nr:hypothetical protein BP6252_05132 [Coleophoma cylindrospora]
MTTSEQIKVWRQEVPCPSSCTLCQPESRTSTSPSDGRSSSEEQPPKPRSTHPSKPNNLDPSEQQARPSSPTRRLSWALKSFLSSKTQHIHVPILHGDPEKAEKKKFQKFCKKGGEDPVEKLDPTRMYEEMLGEMGEDLEGPVSDSWAGDAGYGTGVRGGNMGKEMQNMERLRRAKLRYELDKMAWKQKQPEELIGRVCT